MLRKKWTRKINSPKLGVNNIKEKKGKYNSNEQNKNIVLVLISDNEIKDVIYAVTTYRL